MGIQSILAGIIVNTGLYTINIAVMGFASNLNLFNCPSVFTWATILLSIPPFPINVSPIIRLASAIVTIPVPRLMSQDF